MYVTRNEFEVGLGRTAEFLSTMDELSALFKDDSANVGATLLQSYAYPNRYTIIARWTDRVGALAAGGKEPVTAFARALANNVGLIRPVRSAEAYESVFEVDRPDVGNADESTAERLVEFALTTPLVAPTFEAGIRALAEVSVQRAPGVLSIRLRRSMGIDTKYLLILIAKDHAAARGWLVAPEVRTQVEQQSLSQNLAAAPAGETFFVVKRYVGSPQGMASAAAAGARP